MSSVSTFVRLNGRWIERLPASFNPQLAHLNRRKFEALAKSEVSRYVDPEHREAALWYLRHEMVCYDPMNVSDWRQGEIKFGPWNLDVTDFEKRFYRPASLWHHQPRQQLLGTKELASLLGTDDFAGYVARAKQEVSRKLGMTYDTWLSR
jgi:hypothetical protein